MQSLTFKIAHATLCLTDGEDRLTLYPDLPTAHPEMQYPVAMTIRIRYDYGVEWCKNVLNMTPEIIDTRSKK